MAQPSFFDLDDRFKKLNERDALLQLDRFVDWELFRATLDTVRPPMPANQPGRRPYDNVLMFKGLVMQHLYNLSDEELEFKIRDRFMFMRFLGLQPEAITPDGNTFRDFRERLVKADVSKSRFVYYELHLPEQGYSARQGQIVDASFVEAPRQRNGREENAAIKQGEVPPSLAENPACLSQKDLDVRYAADSCSTFHPGKTSTAG